MLPVCSASPRCTHCQVSLKDGLRNLSVPLKSFEVRCITGYTILPGLKNGVLFPGVFQKTQTTKFLCFHFAARPTLLSSSNVFSITSSPTNFDNVGSEVSGRCNYSVAEISPPLYVGGRNLEYVAEASSSVSVEQPLNSPDTLIENADALQLNHSESTPALDLDHIPESSAASGDSIGSETLFQQTNPEAADKLIGNTDSLQLSNHEAASVLDNLPETSAAPNGSLGTESILPMNPDASSTLNSLPESTNAVSDSFGTAPDSGLGLKSSFDNFLSDMDSSIKSSVGDGRSSLDSTKDVITSSIKATYEEANTAIDNVLSLADQAGEYVHCRLINLSSDLKGGFSKSGYVVVELLRKTTVGVENSLIEGSKFITYSYGYVKELLPQEVQNVLDLSEDKAAEISRPIGMVLKQVYVAVVGFERNLGLDPSDPIITFVAFVGASSALWATYWFATYGGYAGDVSADATLKLLSGSENAVLIDVRPEDLLERDGVPDLRRAARFRYASVFLPEVDGSVRKMMNQDVVIDDILMAVVIRNLKIVGDRSKIIIMDTDGTHSKGIARSLRKLGIKRPYCLQGGFRSWANLGIRIKELKPETTLTILNEEAEAILEDLNPSPVELVGAALGFIAGLYALLEWEKTLQLVGAIGLGQTVYRRVASYQGPEDLRNDVRVLLAPVRLGAEAVSRAAGKLENNGNGLPTSPSSLDVQSRVLQAAAKHESQPIDGEDSEESVSESRVSPDDNVDLSQA